MWHQLWFVVPTLISFDMFVMSITWQHVPGPLAFQCATLKAGCESSYFMLQVNAQSTCNCKHWVELPFKPVQHLLSSMTSIIL